MTFDVLEGDDAKETMQAVQSMTGLKSKSWRTQLLKLIRTAGGRGPTAYANAKWITATAAERIPNIYSRDAFLTEARKAWPKHERTDVAKLRKILALTDEERQTKVDLQTKARHAMLDDVEDIASDVVYAAIEKIRKPKTVNDAIILCMLATGRRMIDVLKVTGEPPEGKKKDHIIIDRVSKDKKEYIINIEVPLIGINYGELVKAWRMVRDYLEKEGDNKKTNREITNKYNARVNRRIVKLFPTIKAPRSHTMRKIYGAMAYRLYGGKQTRERYVGRVLGHVPDSQATQNYTVVKIRNPAISTNTEIKKTVDKINSDVKQLEEKVDKITPSDLRPIEQKLKIIKKKVAQIKPAEGMPAYMIRLNDLANAMEAAGEKLTHRTLRTKARMGYARVKEYFDYRNAELAKGFEESGAKMPIPKKERVELPTGILKTRKKRK